MLHQRGLVEHKADMLFPYGVTSSKELTAGELIEIINGLEQPKYENDHMRKKIISLFRTIGKTDVKEMKDIVEKKWGKSFNNYTKKEYQKIIAVLENTWIPYYLKNIKDVSQ